MKKHGFPGRDYMLFGLAVAALMAATSAPVPAFGADRMVMAELFSDTG